MLPNMPYIIKLKASFLLNLNLFLESERPEFIIEYSKWRKKQKASRDRVAFFCYGLGDSLFIYLDSSYRK